MVAIEGWPQRSWPSTTQAAGRAPSCKLSIIVPTRDRASLLRRALESVTTQCLKGVEVIVVDDGSRDDTKQTVGQFTSVRYQSNPRSSGASAARNQGAAMAHGEWLLFLDDDDELKPGALDVILWRLSGRHDVCMFYLEQVMPSGVSRVPGNQLLHDHAEIDDLISLAFRPISASQVILRAEVFNALSGFDESLKTCEDIDLWARLLRAGAKVTVIQEVLGRKHEHSETQLTRNLPQLFAGHRAFLQKWQPSMKQRLCGIEYHKWYARRLDAIFHAHCGLDPQLTTPLPLSASLRYCAYWLGLAALSTNPVRVIALRRALSSGLRAALGKRAYSVIATCSWMKRYTGSLGL